MFGKEWAMSERKYSVLADREVRVPMSDGVELDVDVFRPDSEEKFPALLAMSPYSKEAQEEQVWPAGLGKTAIQGIPNPAVEAGHTDYVVRRGYAHVIGSVRGTGKSGGAYSLFCPRETRDMYELVEWAAAQPWCNGNVGMIGVSYFAINQLKTASLQPPHLKAIFPMFALTDLYRDVCYHGGILNPTFILHVIGIMDTHTQTIVAREELGEEAFNEAIRRKLRDNGISAHPDLVKALENAEEPPNGLTADLLLHDTDGPFWKKRSVDYEDIRIPAYFGACWGTYALHLPGSFRTWSQLTGAPKKMVIGPPIYLDRPFYQYHHELVRWYDYWLKGIDTRIMEEPPVKVFVMGSNEWKTGEEWPFPETKWMAFNLHPSGVLCEIESLPHGGSDAFEDSPSKRGCLKYYSPPLVENTEVIGPIVLNLYASTTTTDLNLFVSLWDVDPEKKETLLTRGWLKGSYRAIDTERSQPWQPYHSFAKREPLEPGKIYEFAVEVIPTANLFKPGHQIGLKISGVDNEEPKTTLEVLLTPHVWCQIPKTVTVYHDADYPSHLLLPITSGNVIGTYLSGGDIGITGLSTQQILYGDQQT